MKATLTGGSVPRAVVGADVVIVDGEAVVYAAGAVHALNATATLIWKSCDGLVALDHLADELAESFGIARDDARRDVAGVADELLTRGLITVAGVSSGDSELAAGSIPGDAVFQPSSACPGCGDGPAYEQHLLVAAGEVRLSVGADGEIADALATVLGPHVRDRVVAPRDRASYGVVIPAPSRHTGVMQLARLHRGPDVLLASRDPERVLRAVISQVALHAVPEPLVRLEAIAIGTGERAVVAVAPANRKTYARAAAEHGLALSDGSGIAIDLDSMTVRHGPVWTDLDLAPLADAAATRRHLGDEPEALPWRAMDLVGIAVDGPPHAASLVGEMGSGASWDRVPPLARLLDVARSVPIRSGSAPAQIAAILHGG
ncbi:MAG: PqqD family protein [Acidimicrobiia bacterium]